MSGISKGKNAEESAGKKRGEGIEGSKTLI